MHIYINMLKYMHVSLWHKPVNSDLSVAHGTHCSYKQLLEYYCVHCLEAEIMDVVVYCLIW